MTGTPINHWWFSVTFLNSQTSNTYYCIKKYKAKDRVIIFLYVSSRTALLRTILEGFWGLVLHCGTVFICSVTHAAGSSEVYTQGKETHWQSKCCFKWKREAVPANSYIHVSGVLQETCIGHMQLQICIPDLIKKISGVLKVCCCFLLAFVVYVDFPK